LKERYVGGIVVQFYRKPSDSGTQKNGLKENRYIETLSAIDASGKSWLIRKIGHASVGLIGQISRFASAAIKGIASVRQ